MTLLQFFSFQYTDKVIFISAAEDDSGKPEIEYHLAKATGSNNNSMVGMTKAESTDRESAFIVDMSTMRIVRRINGSVAGVGPSAISQIVPTLLRTSSSWVSATAQPLLPS